MKRITPLLIFLLLICTAIPNAAGQENYNPFTLDFFKRSLEYLVIGDYDNAIIYSNNVLRRDPNSAVTYTVRARAHYEKGDLANAIADCTQAIRLDRNNVSAFAIRASANARSGNTERAISDWQAVLRINPDNVDARRNIDLIRSTQ